MFVGAGVCLCQCVLVPMCVGAYVCWRPVYVGGQCLLVPMCVGANVFGANVC